jgi:para-aminobenzoate synthetase/4-amino-4-deoxychorismate lyase
MFSELALLSREQADAWLQQQDEGRTGPDVAGVMNLRPSIDEAEFHQAIERIHEYIRAGETYQINHTWRLFGEAYGSPVALYRRLRHRQPVPYGAWIALPPGDPVGHVLSCSPELFLRHQGGELTARPMKGTASRGGAPEGDSEMARWLNEDIKNRAENLMIVDLLRNDLGRIARTGSVRVPELFAIEAHATLFQMTSTVRATPVEGLGFADLLRATFPCGSITGAPKHHTMELIAELESTPRGLYTGAIGWLGAPASTRARCGDFCLSVAIRTLTLGEPAEEANRPARLGIGAGIVLDSEARAEFDECLLKARFLTGLDPGFVLIETMRATREHGIALLQQHLDRLQHSARMLGFAFDRDAALALIEHHVASLAPGTGGQAPVYRVRLALAHDGRIELGGTALAPLPEGPAKLILSSRTPERPPALAGHKTSVRAAYDEGVRDAERVGAFDALFFTPDGRLIEGGRSNVFVQLDGRWWTPPLIDGPLPGVMRAELLKDPSWQAAERTLRRADLERAEAIVVCNALRGALPATLAIETDMAAAR